MQEKIIQAPDLARAEARMPRWMAALTLGGTLAMLVAGSPRSAIGFLTGGAFGMLNFFWLRQAVAALMHAEGSRLPKRTVAKMLIRYPLSIAVMFLFYQTAWVPIMALMAGLLVPGAGVFIESLVLISAGFRHHEAAG